MIVERSMHESYLSNSYLVGDCDGGCAVIIDTGAPIEPLLAAVERHGLRVTHVLNTHEHHDHTTFNIELQERFGVPLLTADELNEGDVVCSGGLDITVRATPGHTEQHWAFVVNDAVVFTGDVLFRGTVGGTLNGGPDGFAQLRRSVMDVLLGFDSSVVAYPGHMDATTIGDEWEQNPFVRVWRGVDEEGDEPVRVLQHDARLVLWASDYDGGSKAWVRFPDGREAIVGGSKVTRLGARA